MTVQELERFAEACEEQAHLTKDPERARIIAKIARQRAARRESAS